MPHPAEILQVLNALLVTSGETRQRLADQYQDLLMTEDAAQLAEQLAGAAERRVKKLERALSILRAIQEQQEAERRDGSSSDEGSEA